MGRPKTYEDTVVVRLAPDGTTKLQAASDRRAVVNVILEAGGAATIGHINSKMGFDATSIVRALVHSRWLEVGPKE